MMWMTSEKIAWIAFATASLILALHPLDWLVQSWTSYSSGGAFFALLVAGLALRSYLSGAPRDEPTAKAVLPLLLLAASIRLSGQVLAVNTISALALIIDVFALAYLLRLSSRPFALSPLWMAALFMFALPVQHLGERLLGFPLQLISAEAACQALHLLFEEVACQGTRLTVAGQDVLIDLPCSGAGSLTLITGLCVTLNAIYRPRFTVAVLGLIMGLLLAFLGNTLRITLLASGIALQDQLPIDVMLEPWHSAIGLLTLVLSSLPLLLAYRPKAAPAGRWSIGLHLSLLPKPLKLPIALMTVPLALLITQATEQPVDVSGPVVKRMMPAQIAGQRAVPVPLAEIEQIYFQRHGGSAEKATYGSLGLNIVSTRTPLRHLHGPAACLRGLGYSVQFLGTRFDGDLPSAVYLAETDREAWLVSVSFVSSRGEIANGVAEAIWQWFLDPGATWSSVQRLVPAAMPEAERMVLDRAALAALDIPLTRRPEQQVADGRLSNQKQP